MATENKVIDLGLVADEDLSNDQYRYMVMDTTSGRVRRPNAATDIAMGILQNAPAAAGDPATVRPLGCGGTSKIQLGATLTAGAIVQAEYVDAADAGKAIAAVATGYPAGLLITGGAEDELGEVLLASITVKA